MKYEKRIKVTVEGEVVGSLYQRGELYMFDHRVNGKRVGESLKTKDLKQALANAELIAKNTPIIPQAPTLNEKRQAKTLADVFELYQQFYGAQKKRDREDGQRRRTSTNRRAYQVVKDFNEFIGETRSVGYVERDHIKAFIKFDSERISETTGRKLSRWTVNNNIGRVRQFLFWAAREGYRHAAPDFAELKLKAKKKKARGLAPEEIETVRTKIADCPDERLRETLQDWFELGINVGLRPGEQAHLMVKDYDPKERLLTIQPSEEAEVEEDDTDDGDEHELKTENSERVCWLNDDAHAVMERLVAKARPAGLAAGVGGDALLFPNPVGNVWHLDTLRHHFTGNGNGKKDKRPGILPRGTYFRLYALRHSFAYRAVTADWSVVKLQLYMGHSDPKTTMGYYRKLKAKQVGAPPALEPRKVAAQA